MFVSLLTLKVESIGIILSSTQSTKCPPSTEISNVAFGQSAIDNLKGSPGTQDTSWLQPYSTGISIPCTISYSSMKPNSSLGDNAYAVIVNKPGTETKSEDGSYTSHPIAMHKHKQAAIAPFRNQLCFCFAR